MSSDKNIKNAFAVVRQTYESIYNLFLYLQNETAKRGNFELVTPMPRFLRWKSDVEFERWLINDFILLFQNKNDVILENHWRNGSVYALEINLWEYYEVPTAILIRFDYHDIGSWNKGVSAGDFWGFYNPIHTEGSINYVVNDETTFEGDAVGDGEAYWGLKSVKGSAFPLTEITVENAFDKIIGGFEELY